MRPARSGRARAAAAGGSLALLLAVAACAPTAASSEESGSPGESAAPEVSAAPTANATECVVGQWSADLDDLIGQLADQLAASGLTVSGADATGSQTLSIGREGVLGFDADMTFTLAVDMGGGLTMTMTQAHTGTLQASWDWTDDATAEGGTIRFSDFQDSGYAVQTTVDINGRAADAPFPPPSVAAADVPTVVACEGDTMTTHPEGSPFTTTWNRTD